VAEHGAHFILHRRNQATKTEIANVVNWCACGFGPRGTAANLLDPVPTLLSGAIDPVFGSISAGADAERELKAALRAKEIAKSSSAGTDLDNWLRAEWEVDVAQRAEEIARSRPAGSDLENWLCAERELAAERAAKPSARRR
jgi:hypothetical protein